MARDPRRDAMWGLLHQARTPDAAPALPLHMEPNPPPVKQRGLPSPRIVASSMPSLSAKDLGGDSAKARAEMERTQPALQMNGEASRGNNDVEALQGYLNAIRRGHDNEVLPQQPAVDAQATIEEDMDQAGGRGTVHMQPPELLQPYKRAARQESYDEDAGAGVTPAGGLMELASRVRACERQDTTLAQAMDSLSEQVASQASQAVSITKSVEALRSSVPLLQTVDGDMRRVKQELSERLAACQTHVELTEQSVQRLNGELSRVQEHVTAAERSMDDKQRETEELHAKVKQLAGKQEAAVHAASASSTDKFQLVAKDLGELGSAMTGLQAENKRLEGMVRGEALARRSAWEAVEATLKDIRAAAGKADQQSIERMAHAIEPLESRLSSGMQTFEKILEGEKKAREIADAKDMDERRAIASSLSARISDIEAKLSVVESSQARRRDDDMDKHAKESMRLRDALDKQAASQRASLAQVEKRLARTLAEVTASLMLRADRVHSAVERTQQAIAQEGGERQVQSRELKQAVDYQAQGLARRLYESSSELRTLIASLELRVRKQEETQAVAQTGGEDITANVRAIVEGQEGRLAEMQSKLETRLSEASNQFDALTTNQLSSKKALEDMIKQTGEGAASATRQLRLELSEKLRLVQETVLKQAKELEGDKQPSAQAMEHVLATMKGLVNDVITMKGNILELSTSSTKYMKELNQQQEAQLKLQETIDTAIADQKQWTEETVDRVRQDLQDAQEAMRKGVLKQVSDALETAQAKQAVGEALTSAVHRVSEAGMQQSIEQHIQEAIQPLQDAILELQTTIKGKVTSSTHLEGNELGEASDAGSQHTVELDAHKSGHDAQAPPQTHTQPHVQPHSATTTSLHEAGLTSQPHGYGDGEELRPEVGGEDEAPLSGARVQTPRVEHPGRPQSQTSKASDEEADDQGAYVREEVQELLEDLCDVLVERGMQERMDADKAGLETECRRLETLLHHERKQRKALETRLSALEATFHENGQEWLQTIAMGIGGITELPQATLVRNHKGKDEDDSHTTSPRTTPGKSLPSTTGGQATEGKLNFTPTGRAPQPSSVSPSPSERLSDSGVFPARPGL